MIGQAFQSDPAQPIIGSVTDCVAGEPTASAAAVRARVGQTLSARQTSALAECALALSVSNLTVLIAAVALAVRRLGGFSATQLGFVSTAGADRAATAGGATAAADTAGVVANVRAGMLELADSSLIGDWLRHLDAVLADWSVPAAAPQLAVASQSCGQTLAAMSIAGWPAPGLIVAFADADTAIELDFERALINTAGAHALLELIVAALAVLPSSLAVPIAAFEPLSVDQRTAILAGHEAPDWCWLGPMNVWSVFAQQCRTHPSAIALRWANGQCSYAQLNANAQALAAQLHVAGVRRNDVVAVALQRGPALITSLLAILRCGAAYLPIDPTLPEARIAFMLQDAKVAVTMVADTNADTNAFGVRLRSEMQRFTLEPALLAGTALLNAAAMPVAEFSLDDSPTDEDGESIAYIMYTSGSTGTPKGVTIRQRSIIRLVMDASFMRLDASVCMLQTAPLGFDASTLEIWGPLLNGGCCVLHAELVPTAQGLGETIRVAGVNAAWLTAALFNAVVEQGVQHLRGLTQLVIGGEALSVAHVRTALDALGDTTIINGYGPTECTTFAATYTIARPLAEHATNIPIGRPIARTVTRILNARLQLLPPGFVGELYIGGDGLALNYLGNPTLTAQHFIADPYGTPGARLYRSGDLVRLTANGDLEFLGRRDRQVKIRGYRIELGEIEQAIAAYTGVRACAVLARDDGTIGESIGKPLVQSIGKRLVAYLVADDTGVDLAALRQALAAQLPAFMQPVAWVRLNALPVTSNGKLDRAALPKPATVRDDLPQDFEQPVGAAETGVANTFAQILAIEPVGALDNFFDLGGDSLAVTRAVALLAQSTGSAVAVAAFFGDPTPRGIARLMATADAVQVPTSTMAQVAAVPSHDDHHEPIAIIGMAVRLPGASSIETFWDNLCAGRDSITVFDQRQLDPSIDPQLTADKDYVRARGVIADADCFDAGFFGITAAEAELMDPQQRVLLELSWECIERAGYVPDAIDHPVGVFAGVYNASYFQNHVLSHPDKVAAFGAFQVMLANEKDYVATRIAHRLNLTGPAISVFTACSTSLVAIAQAVDSLRLRRCRAALAGGATITSPPNSGYVYQEGAMLSPDGRTRSFDAQAQGTVFSDGAAMVMLKRLSDAQADGDTIHALIRGAAVNNDGRGKASFTAPSVEGQVNVIAAALRDANVDARSIDYLEAHGTATPMGDPVEVEALTRAYRQTTSDQAFCSLGSVKSNIGHTVMAAGAAGVIKTALALSREWLPATINYSAPNPSIRFNGGPFVVAHQAASWLRGAKPRLAGVSSFGVGGTNAHLILQEAPIEPMPALALPPAALNEPPLHEPPLHEPQLLRLSARSKPALAQAAALLAAHLRQQPQINLADVAYTLRVGRKGFAHRLAIVANDVQSAIVAIEQTDSPDRLVSQVAQPAPPVLFLFPGQGAQYAAMGSMLYAHDPAFREAMDRCFAALRGHTAFDLAAILFADDDIALQDTAVTQPATFCIEYALASCWLARGLRPSALIGHSVGEFVAAVLAGVMSLEDGALLVARRGALMQALPKGQMLAVRMAAADLQKRLPADVSLAAENAPLACVVAGPHDAIEALRGVLERDGISARALATSHAFHSAMMDAAVAPFERELAAVRLSAPKMPIISTVSAAVLTDQQAIDPAYWAQHLRLPVRFAPAVASVIGRGDSIFVEVGPRASLSALVRQQIKSGAGSQVLASLGETAQSELQCLQRAVAKLWTLGINVNPGGSNARRRIVLPTYPFERQRHWLDARPVTTPVAALPTASLSTATLPSASPSPSPSPSPMTATVSNVPAATAVSSRASALSAQLRDLLESVSGVELADADPVLSFVQLGLDSLTLTQAALQIKRTFSVPVSFRQLMGEYRSLSALTQYLEQQLPVDPAADSVADSVAEVAPPAMSLATPSPTAAAAAIAFAEPTSALAQVIQQQLALMHQQLQLLGAAPAVVSNAISTSNAMNAVAIPVPTAKSAASVPAPLDDELASTKSYDVRKAFGAIARIHSNPPAPLTERQKARLAALINRYVARTKASKEYTLTYRDQLADPRVVNGFRPLLKEIIYQIVINKSRGSRMWDLDGNEYIDVLSGFGMNLFGWQPQFVLDAIRQQLSDGYDIGPQHPLAGKVAQAICRMTGSDRAALCNTGSEAVMGCVRIARTVTGRSKIAIFNGAYHGIFDEVIVRGTKKGTSIPAAPGIMPNSSESVVVLEYGTPEALRWIEDNAADLAAVLVEPVQSRRPDFQPIQFLRELRTATSKAGIVLIFDEVVTGFRSHPGGVQALFDVKADLASYGKVVGGGFPIGVIAGKREFMDALDGGHWRYGDDSTPTVGVTYFAGTFVRHPLALAAAMAVLTHLQREGPALQSGLNARTAQFVAELNQFCQEVRAPITVKSFSSVWKIFFDQDHPLQDLLFAMMRSRGIHILDNFPCFMTTAHSEADLATIKTAFCEAIREMQESEFLPGGAEKAVRKFDASCPPLEGARLGRDANGRPAWFIKNPDVAGKYLQIEP